MDHCLISASAFDRQADSYRKKFMDLTIYDDFYREFCDLLTPGRARVLDAACGPGNVSHYLMARRPDLDMMGIDLPPRMVELARKAVPSAQFAVHDCRHLLDLQRRFDGIICAFGLPYLLPEEVTAFVGAAGEALDSGGVLCLSVMLGNRQDSGFHLCSNGDQVYINYHSEDHITRSLGERGFSVVRQSHMASPSAASKATIDLIVIAKK
jgi:predicted TPR repeat methyltransferase